MPPAVPRLLSAGLTDQGNVRGNNEDRFHIDDQRGIYIVVDGMGGQAAGEEAAEIAVKTLRARLERPTESAELRVREAIALANNAIYEAARANPEWLGMACVLTVVVVEDAAATVGHVGDSRLYLIRGGRIEKITNDHSPVGEREDSGDLTEEAAMNHPRRNEVYRDVGSAIRTPDDPDFIEVRTIAFPPDSALLLCSDGLSDVVPSRRILQIVEASAGDCSAAVRKLVHEAVADGKDNVSVVLVEGEEYTKPAALEPAAQPVSIYNSRETSVAGRSGWRAFGWLLLGCLLGVAAASAFSLLRPRTPSPAAPRTIRVAPQGGDFSSIPEAIQSANRGDTIQLAPGRYQDRILLRSDLRIAGPPSGESTLLGEIVADGVHDAAVEGFAVEGGSGITIRNSTVQMERMRVTGAKAAGVDFQGESQGVLRGSQIVGNIGPGVIVRDTASPLVENNFISGNGKGSGPPGPGIEFLSSGAMQLKGNGIAGNGAESLWLKTPPDAAVLALNILEPAKRPYRIVSPGGQP